MHRHEGDYKVKFYDSEGEKLTWKESFYMKESNNLIVYGENIKDYLLVRERNNGN